MVWGVRMEAEGTQVPRAGEWRSLDQAQSSTVWACGL